MQIIVLTKIRTKLLSGARYRKNRDQIARSISRQECLLSKHRWTQERARTWRMPTDQVITWPSQRSKRRGSQASTRIVQPSRESHLHTLRGRQIFRVIVSHLKSPLKRSQGSHTLQFSLRIQTHASSWQLSKKRSLLQLSTMSRVMKCIRTITRWRSLAGSLQIRRLMSQKLPAYVCCY